MRQINMFFTRMRICFEVLFNHLSARQRVRRRPEPRGGRVLQLVTRSRKRLDRSTSHNLVGLREGPPEALVATVHVQPARVDANHSRE